MRTPRKPAYNDLDKMPFGKYGPGQKELLLQEVPAKYLLWLWEQGKNNDIKLDNYIYNSLSALQEETPDHILKRKE